MDKTHIDKIAQQVLQIANRDIKNAFGENGGCVRDTRTEFTTEIDHVDIADIVYPGYTLWYDEYGDIGARCEVLIVADVFTDVNAYIDDIKLYQALDVVMGRALKDAGICQKSKLLDKIQETADKVIGEWLEAVGRSYHNQIESLSTQVDYVTVSESRIDFNYRCDYKFYYEHAISRWTNEDSDWDEDDDILVNILNDAGWDKDCPDVWCEIYFNDRDFSFR